MFKFFESKKGKNLMSKLYGWGAAVVILGAMFKILHWDGADLMLTLGLTTEAIIFFISGFEKPHAEINLKDGKWLTVIAKEGIFDLEKQTLELIDDVLFLHGGGQQIDTNNAIIDLKKGKIYGNKKIFGKSETINFSSDGFELNKTGKIFQLLGKSKIKIKKENN